jgi:hypothetical protein
VIKVIDNTLKSTWMETVPVRYIGVNLPLATTFDVNV